MAMLNGPKKPKKNLGFPNIVLGEIQSLKFLGIRHCKPKGTSYYASLPELIKYT